jgi:lipid-A-disaccharide synthase
VIAKALIKIKFISLVNLIMDRKVVTELIQGDCNPAKIREEMSRLIEDVDYRNEMLNNFDALRKELGEGGASEKVARSLLKTI